MLGYLKKLEKPNAPMHADLDENIILGSLPPSYRDVVLHIHMHENIMALDKILQTSMQADVDITKHNEEKNVLLISQNCNKSKTKKGKRDIRKRT
jgi:hypothetical protein